MICLSVIGGILLTTPAGDSVRTLMSPLVTRHAAQYADWSPDRQMVYYLAIDSVATNIYAISTSDGTPRVVMRFDDPTRPWHRYGFQVFRDRLYFTVGDRQSDIWVAELAVKP